MLIEREKTKKRREEEQEQEREEDLATEQSKGRGWDGIGREGKVRENTGMERKERDAGRE